MAGFPLDQSLLPSYKFRSSTPFRRTESCRRSRPYLWRSFAQPLALIGLLATLACFVDMNVQVLGDGRADITKHLFLANVLFDLAAIAALNVVVVELIEWRQRKSGV